MKYKKGSLLKAGGMLLTMTVICGVLYTAFVAITGQLLFKDKVNGSIIEVNGVKYGSELLGQEFQDDNHMWGRIMNVKTITFQGEDGMYYMYSEPSNLSPKSKEYQKIVNERVELILGANPDADVDKIPVDLVTSSGSGLDPHISLAAARYQIPRLAKNNNMSEEEVGKIIERCTNHKILGIFGETTVNVLKVNLMLEGIL